MRGARWIAVAVFAAGCGSGNARTQGKAIGVLAPAAVSATSSAPTPLDEDPEHDWHTWNPEAIDGRWYPVAYINQTAPAPPEVLYRTEAYARLHPWPPPADANAPYARRDDAR